MLRFGCFPFGCFLGNSEAIPGRLIYIIEWCVHRHPAPYQERLQTFDEAFNRLSIDYFLKRFSIWIRTCGLGPISAKHTFRLLILRNNQFPIYNYSAPPLYSPPPPPSPRNFSQLSTLFIAKMVADEKAIFLSMREKHKQNKRPEERWKGVINYFVCIEEKVFGSRRWKIFKIFPRSNGRQNLIIFSQQSAAFVGHNFP